MSEAVQRIISVSHVNKDFPWKKGMTVTKDGKYVGILDKAEWNKELELWEIMILPFAHYKTGES